MGHKLGWTIAMGLGLASTTSVCWSQEKLEVTKLRTESVALLDCNDLSKQPKLFARSEFTKPWTVIEKGAPSGLLKVKVDDQDYCVRPFAVETNKRVGAPECGVLLAAGPRAAATRNLGGECKP